MSFLEIENQKQNWQLGMVVKVFNPHTREAGLSQTNKNQKEGV